MQREAIVAACQGGAEKGRRRLWALAVGVVAAGAKAAALGCAGCEGVAGTTAAVGTRMVGRVVGGCWE